MLKIGICDDFSIFREVIEVYIQQYAEKKHTVFNVWQFNSGEELLDWIDKENAYFDLLFLDYYMKKLTGLETAKRLRQLEATGSNAASNIVFVTSMDQPYELMSVHPMDIVRKPVSEVIINNILTKVLSGKDVTIATSASCFSPGRKER